jgi:hypothetical protein
MRVVIENRAEQTLRHLSDSDAAKIARVIDSLREESIQTFRARKEVRVLGRGALGHVYSFRATKRLRIICKYVPDDQALVVEDIVSHDVLNKWSSGSG